MHCCSRCFVDVAGSAAAWKGAGSAHHAGHPENSAVEAGAIAQKHCVVAVSVAGDGGFQVEGGIAGKDL